MRRPPQESGQEAGGSEPGGVLKRERELREECGERGRAAVSKLLSTRGDTSSTRQSAHSHAFLLKLRSIKDRVFIPSLPLGLQVRRSNWWRQ